MVAIQQYPEIDIVVPVLFSGATEGVPEISKFATNNKFVVKDAAHALGSSYFCGSKVGSCKYSDCTAFSFHPVKSIAAGEGGIITTNDEQIYKSLLNDRMELTKEKKIIVFRLLSQMAQLTFGITR